MPGFPSPGPPAPLWPLPGEVPIVIPAGEILPQAPLRGAAGFSSGTAATTAIDVTFPPQLQVGDMMLVFSAQESTVATTWSCNAPVSNAAFSTIAAVNGGATAGVAQLIYKIADAQDVINAHAGAHYTVTESGSHLTACIAAAYGLPNFDPVPAASGQVNASSTTISVAGITTVNAGDTLIWFGYGGAGSGAVPATVTPPAGFTLRCAQADCFGTGTNVGLALADTVQVTAGATGAENGTLSSSHTNGGMLLALSASPLPLVAVPGPLISPAAVTTGFGQPAAGVISRSSLADAPVLTTPPPQIIPAAATPGFGQPNAGQTSRNSLADAPVLTTTPPLVIQAAPTVGWGTPGPAVISSAPFIAAAAPPATTPAPAITPAAATPGFGQPVPGTVSRSSLADAPVLTTPRPVVVMATAVTPHGRPQAAVIAASPAAPAAAAAVTPQPVVVAQQAKATAAQPPVILRNTFADPPVLTTPRPVVVWMQVLPPQVMTVISGAPVITGPPPFTIGALTASDVPDSVLAGATGVNALTGSTAAANTITAADQRTGGPS